MEFPQIFVCARREGAGFEKTVPAPWLRKSFSLDELPQKARLLITGLGFYRVYLNGKELTKGPLAPYISNPDDLVYFDPYQVEAELKPGENVIGIWLGNGMNNGFGGYIWDFDKARCRSAPKTAFSLKMSAGSWEKEIVSGTDMRTAPSPIWFDELRCGEYYDASLEQPGWNCPGFDDTDWQWVRAADPPRGEYRICETEPIVITQELKPVNIVPQEDGFLYDFGCNWSGVCRLLVSGYKGQEIVMQHGELLKDGKLTLENIDYTRPGYIQKDIYRCKGGGEECYTPGFTYHGFRYCLVKGISRKQAVPSLLTYLVMNTDLKERGGFRCSDEILNELQRMARRSTLANFYYFPTDCPHREKNGWTADAALSAEHTLMNLSADTCYMEWMRNIRKAQRESGELPGIVPTTGWGYEWGNGPAWDYVIVELPYETYRYTGNIEILRENAPSIFRYLYYLAGRRQEDGCLAFGLGDWCPPGRPNDAYKAPLVVTDTLIGIEICRKAAKIFEVLGRKAEKAYAETLGTELRCAARKAFLEPGTFTVAGCCQTCQAMGIYYGLFEPSEIQQAFGVLLELIHKMEDHMDTGVLGARVIFHVLSSYGEAQLALTMIENPTWPSYWGWIEMGETTLCEDFIQEEEKRQSRNHHFWGDISAWFLKELSGIHYNPQFTNLHDLEVRPHFPEGLLYAEGFHITPYGKVTVRWERNGEGIVLQLKYPEQIEPVLCLETGQKIDRQQSLEHGQFQILNGCPLKQTERICVKETNEITREYLIKQGIQERDLL